MGKRKSCSFEQMNFLFYFWGYGYSNVLFKPTKAAEYPWRPTGTGALSYFVGGDNVQGGYSEDGGFAHNGGKGWSKVEFADVQISLQGPVAIAMGHYLFTQATGEGAGSVAKVEFTFGYKRDENEKMRIFLHHSSMPYSYHTNKGKHRCRKTALSIIHFCWVSEPGCYENIIFSTVTRNFLLYSSAEC